MEDLRTPWLDAGYEAFAAEGPAGLKVEALARKVGKSKSSFYHHFADLDVFTEALLERHTARSLEMTEAEGACPRLVPDLLLLLLDCREDLLFSRQLRIHREVPAFRRCFERTNELAGTAMLDIWAEGIGLRDRKHLAQDMLGLMMENFYAQLTAETLTYAWLERYVEQVRSVVAGIGAAARR